MEGFENGKHEHRKSIYLFIKTIQLHFIVSHIEYL